MDLLDEIQEDLRSEQFRKFWQRYSKLLIGAVVLLIAVTALTSGYKQYRQYQSAKDAAAYNAAMDLAEAQKRDEAIQQFAAIAGDAGPGYKTLALFSEASLKFKSGDKAGAVAAYDKLADARGLDSLYRELAVICSVSIQLDQPNPNYAALEKRLDALTGTGKPWRHSALELQGLIAMQNNEKDKAKSIFDRLVADKATPEAMKARADRVASVLSY